MIRCTNLVKRFGALCAVDGVSLEAPDGRVTGLLGPNGAGKTTTLRLMTGLLTPDTGQVHVDGLDPAHHPQAAHARLGVLPDGAGLYPRLTAREHLTYAGRLAGLRGAALAARVDDLLARLEMGAIADRRAQGFSQGERCKVALARALVHDPPNLLLDEPTNGLDVATARAVRALILELKAQGRAVVFSSHVMQEVVAVCDDLVLVAHGRVVARGTPDEIRSQAGTTDLEEAFVRLTGARPAAGALSDEA